MNLEGFEEHPIEEGSKRGWILHPILFAIYPIARLYEVSQTMASATELVWPVAVSVGVTLLLWFISAKLLKSSARGAGVASALIVMFFAYDSVRVMLPEGTSVAVVTGTWLLVTIGLAFLAGYKWARRPTAFLNVTSVLLLANLGWGIASDMHLGFTQVAKWSRYFGKTSAGRPDIYYIILDGYGRSDALQKYVGLDNSSFVANLKSQGFYIADKGHSNYCQTEQSLSSSLNMDFLPNVVGDISPDSTDREPLDQLIDRNRVSLLLKEQGYRYVSITTGFPPIHPASADLHIPKSLKVSRFDSALLDASPIGKSSDVIDALRENRRGLILSAINNLPKVADDYDEPCFIFVHILAPHPPFVFAADGTPANQPRMPFAYADGDDYVRLGGTPEAYQTGYVGQAAYVSKLVSGAVEKILALPGPKPIVIVQGDHGSKSHFKQNNLLQTDPNEVFSNLNAYYVPKAVRDELYPSITPVNTFRTVLRVMFKEKLPNLPDRSYYSKWDTPYQFTEVTSQLK